ncbi:WD_REPEATS_REGION domain-containing protein [Linnemannia gamsii]|uniref:WD_REPEATS_REGION domain-containing protein n=1 Tax=Linnemannia gamsii TaxID=64522 RepID=A0ABQ7JSA9_9FUNG|nr:WD_REPEATS_REGION domain-containing protein [Linnemannia gamsii]
MPNHSLEQLKPLTVPFDPSASEPSFHGESAVDSVTPTHKTIAGFLPENVFKSAIKTDLPRLRERIEKTEQLVYCNTLLLMSQSSSSAIATTKEKDEGFLEGSDGNGQQGPYDERIISSNLDESERAWMQALQQKPVEQHYLRWLVTKVVEEFVKDDIKSPAAIAEAVILGPVLNRDSFRSLLSCFIQKLERSTLPDISLLEGLVQLVESASSGHLEYNDLVKTLAVLQHRLKGTHKRPFEHLSRTILAVCRVLDVIVNGTFKHLNRTEDHHPLAVILDELKDSKEPMLQFQVNYALQALQYVPDDKSSYEATKSILSGMEASQRSRLVDMENFLKGICTGTKHEWYLTLLAARMFVRDGRLADFNRTVCEAHCRNERAFQLGVCQILGEIAVDPLWNPVTRQRVVDLMGAIYNGNTDWQQHRDVKQWIFSIITQLSGLPDAIIKDQVDSILQVLNQDGITADLKFFPLKTRTPRPETSPLLERAHKILYIEHDLHRMVERRLDEVERRLDEVQQPQIYIPPMAKANLQARDEDIFPLMSKVEEFLASDHQVMLILGASGAGKSTFNKHLESQLLRYYKCGDSIPLFINLSALENPARDLMMEQLKEKDFSEMQIQELKLNRQFVVICDGYDESQLTANLHATNKFNRPGQWNVKLLISCRTDYLGPDSNYHDRFAPHGIDHYHGLALDLFQEAAIAPFSMDQIHDYVEMYVSSEPQTWSTQDYMDKLSTIPKLMELVENPLLLSLALKALPRVTKDKQDLSTIRITPVRLYDTFVTDWLDINEIRLQRKTLSEEDRDALFQLVEAGFETEGIEYSTNLASAMFEKQDGKVTVQYTHHKDKTTWKAKFFSSDPAVRLLRESSFLTRSGRYYQFLHRSMLEYFFSRTIVGPRNIEHVGEFPPQPASDTSHVQLLKSKCPLFTRNLVAESSVVQFLCERVQENANFKKELLEVIEISKSDASKATAAANAITILVKAGVTFHRYDFGGIRIPGADLSGGQFDSSNFHGADLKGVNLGMSWLRNANFRYALMKEVKKVASAGADKTVRLWDLVTGEALFVLEGHTDIVKGIRFTSDGQRVVSGSCDETIRFWDAKTGGPEDVWEPGQGAVTCLAISPDGDQLVSGHLNGMLMLWGAATGSVGLALPGHIDAVMSVLFSANGKRIASASLDSTVRLLDSAKGTIISLSGLRCVYVAEWSSPRLGGLFRQGSSLGHTLDWIQH